MNVTMMHAVHSCGILDDGKIIYGGEAAGYVLRFADGRTLYFAGDTNVFSDMQLIEQLYQPELAFLPIGDLFTMSPREAALPPDAERDERDPHALRHLSRRSPGRRNSLPNRLRTCRELRSGRSSRGKRSRGDAPLTLGIYPSEN